VEPAISVRGLTKHYEQVTALDGVDLAIETGTIYGLVGPNGAGKTTLIRTLVGSLRPDGGTVSILDEDPAVDRFGVRARIGYMPQSAVLYADLTARENVRFFQRGHHRRLVDAAVEEALEFADLAEFADRPVNTLSGGVQQRVSLAVAMAHRPEVLLLDEPTAGVDPELRHVFWTGFRTLTARGTTILVTTHQMDEVVHCDRVALLRRGRILAESTPAALLASGGAAIRIRSGSGVTEQRVADAGTDLPGILREKGLDPSVERIDVEPATLEEVILGLVEDDG
jgi:ABC-2 type transport system ATP-binding protein